MELGADDFLSKPFDGSVLMAKIAALLRRAYDYAPLPRLELGELSLSPSEQALFCGQTRVELTRNETRILSCLFENQGRIVSRERLMERLWATDSFIDDNTLTVNGNRLRAKLREAGIDHLITTRVGAGYAVGL